MRTNSILRAVGVTRFLNFTRSFSFQTTKLINDFPSYEQDDVEEFPSFENKTPVQIFDFYVTRLQRCAERKSLAEVRRVHLHMKKSGFPHLSLGNKLIDAYLKCGGGVDDAREVFDEMPQPHIVIWNSMVSSYIRCRRSLEGIRLYETMLVEGVMADEFTYSSVFKGFSDLGLLREGRTAHGRFVVSGLEVANVFVGSALVDMYAKFGKLKDARLVSDRIVGKDVVLFTALIVGYTQNGEDDEALVVFRNMIMEGVRANDFTFSSILIACGNLTNMSKGKQIHSLVIKSGFEFAVASQTSLLSMYAKCGLIDDSLKVFDRFINANLVTWTALITGLVENSREESALSMFCQMIRSSINPNAFTISTALRACSILATLALGKQIHVLVLKLGLDRERFIGAALVDMYGKCGNIEMAASTFGVMIEPDLVSVNSMINGYAQSGYGHEAVKLFNQIRDMGLEPNNATFVSVLSACSNAGLLEEGRRIFSSLKKAHNSELLIDHYARMVDLLGRAGRLEEAEKLIAQVKNPDVVLWRTLLSACKIHGEVEMAKRIMNRVIELEPGDEPSHILLSNIYAWSGNWTEVTKMKVMMKDMKMKKSPAMSWIEADGEVHKFMAGDLSSHPRSMEIDEELKTLRGKIETFGYVPDMRFVLQDLNEEEKERSLGYHSEKLAITFGLLSSRNSTSCIRIFKNLRVCGDCHNWIKYVSKVVGREIIARDAKRFHHFRDGSCSCGDYW